MDNASWHHLEKGIQLCRDARVVLELLCPYSPDLNPIEEHFGVFKKRKWHENEDLISREFKMFLECCVDVVGDDEHIAEYHFRHAGISIRNKSCRNKQIEPRKKHLSCLKTSFLSQELFNIAHKL